MQSRAEGKAGAGEVPAAGARPSTGHTAPNGRPAELILKGRAVFSGCQDEPFAGGVAISSNKITAVARGEEILAWAGPDTRVIECGDRLILPGFIDAHTHYFLGAVAASSHMCAEIAHSTSEAECVEMVRRFAAAHPEEPRILGAGWFPANWHDAPLPTRLSLDAAVPDRPVYLICADVHTFWLNSKALEECGITKEMAPEGQVGVLADGSLSGLLFEMEAGKPALERFMDFDREAMKEIHRAFLQRLAAVGITAASEMTADDYTPENYSRYEIVREMEEAGELTCRLHLYTRLAGYTDFSAALALKEQYGSGRFRLSGVKGFVDGVTSTYTGYLLEPYADRPDTCGVGVPVTPRAELAASVTAANAAGLPVRLHCVGDAAVRMALDLFEASAKENGNYGLANTVEHIESIHPDDIPRFAQLSVVPSMQPYHLTLDADEKIGRIGPARCRYEWPHKSLLEQGAALALGSDYPVVSFDPFLEIYAAVTRCGDAGEPTGTNPQECIRLADALKAYTAGAACAYGRREELGTLEEGKLADVIVLDRNLFAAAPEDILSASVTLTVMDGEVIYESGADHDGQ